MGESEQTKIRQLLDYEKLSAIHPLKPPKIEKQDIPDYISCSKYEKAKNKLNEKMERYQTKVDRLNDEIRQTTESIAQMGREYDKWHSKANPLFGVDENNIDRVNNAIAKANYLVDKIDKAKDKLNDLIDKHTEAVEEADEKLQELTLEALLVIDEDIAATIDRCAEIVRKLAASQNVKDLLEAIDICMIEMRMYTLFEDLIEDNALRKDCRERVSEGNQLLAKFCSNEQVRNYLADMFRRNQALIQKNSDILKQINQVLGSIKQSQLNSLTQSINATLSEKINTSFEYIGVVDPAQLDAVIIEINNSITALKQNIVRANEAATTASSFAKAGVRAEQQAATLLSSMKANVEAMQNDIITQGHFTILLIDEDIIEDFYEKEIRQDIAALRQHLISAIGRSGIDKMVQSDTDRFLLGQAENAIKQANLARLQAVLDKIPAHINKINGLLASAYSDIDEAGKVPKQNADALNAELSGKYIQTCLPLIGLFAANGILKRVKDFEPAFRSTNQIYQNLAYSLFEKNKKMIPVVIMIGAFLGLGGIVFFFGMFSNDNITANIVIPTIVLALYAITAMILAAIGKRLRFFFRGEVM